MMPAVIQVALGGAIGAALRYLLGVGVARVWHGPIPLGVLAANILGSFVLGVFVVYAERKGLTHLAPLIMTGMLGGFTTFSAFALETITLWERGALHHALIYLTLSVILSVGGLVVGLWAARVAFS